VDVIIYYLLTGVVSGVLAGLLGIGGGLIIVPALAYLLPLSNIAPQHVMHLAVGTSLAVVVVTAISSATAHHKKGTVNWALWRVLSPGLIAGTSTGAFIADQLSGHSLRLFFVVFEVLVAIQLVLGKQAQPATREPPFYISFIAAFLIGIVCAFAGVGGGIMIVPLLIWMKLTIKQAVSTSAACGVPIAIAGTIGYMVTGLDVPVALPQWTTGFVYWPAFLGISIPSVFFAPYGAKLAHALPAKTLRQVFATFLVVLAVLMLLK